MESVVTFRSNDTSTISTTTESSETFSGSQTDSDLNFDSPEYGKKSVRNMRRNEENEFPSCKRSKHNK